MSKYIQLCFRKKYPPLAIAIFSTSILGILRAEDSNAAISQTMKTVAFDPTFLNTDDEKTVDLSRFAYGSSGIPGVYKTAMYVNDQFINKKDIELRARNDKSIYPCLSTEVLKSITFNYDKLPDNFFNQSNVEGCIDLQQYLPEAKVNYDSNEQRLDIVIPQLYMLKVARGTVSPQLWDSGIPALLLGYNINGYHSEMKNQQFNSLYAGINAGLNIGSWYLRHNGSYSSTNSGPDSYGTINTYLQHDVPLLKARMLIGQSNTNGDLFDTLPFSGVQMVTDERMLPESLRGYAPEIQGIARTNARVTVRQGELVLYETTVTPGVFLINDLYPTGYGGDLNVTVREADGTEQRFNVPYASVAQLLRPGSSRYAITAGKLRNDNVREKPMVYQATWQHGLTNALTGYGGAQFSQNYYAVQLGAAVGTPVGAVSFDITQAHARLGEEEWRNNTRSGQSYQVSYSKLIREINSNISLAAYRFSTDGYMDFMTAMQTRDALQRGFSSNAIWRAKNRMTLTYGQGLPKRWGQLYLNGSVQNYWNKAGTDEQFQLGYNNQYKQLTWGISAARSFSSLGAQQTNYLVSFSLPLGRDDRVATPRLRADLTHDTSGRTGQQVTLSGVSGEESQFSYGVTAMHVNQNVGTSGTLSGNYRSVSSSLMASASTGKSYRSASAGMSGTVVGHSGGLTFTPYTSDTFALVEAKGAEGAKVSSYPGVRIDSHGYAVVPYLNPYQMNDISIDPKGIPAQTELESTNQKSAPYSGAVVKMKYDTRQGTAVLINVTWKGEPVPFGAEVLDSQGNRVGSTGQGGQIYTRVTRDHDRLQVKWTETQPIQCQVSYQLMPVAAGRTAPLLQQFNRLCE